MTGAQSVVGYDLANGTYDSVSFSVSSQDTEPWDIAFNADGTKMLMVGAGSDSVHQYTLSTAYDLSTASYDSVSFSVSGQDSNPSGIRFNNDGTKMFVVGRTSDKVHQYSLTTAYDISTASYDSQSLSVSSQDGNMSGIAFNDDGTKLIAVGYSGDAAYQYSLTTAFDISTASYDSVSFSVSGQDTTPKGLYFNNDGTKMFLAGSGTDEVYQYSLTTAFDISTASYDSVKLDVGPQAGDCSGVSFSADGTKMYVINAGSDAIQQYSTSTTTAITITWDADIEWGGGTAPDSPAAGEKDLYTITTDDGGTTYFGVQSGDAFS